MNLRSGLRVDPLNISADSIHITDIASSLSKLCRYTGHCSKFYSVAEHCLNCAHVLAADPTLALWGLLHDACEAYLGDIATPLKGRVLLEYADEEAKDTVVAEYKAVETALLYKVAQKFKLPWPIPEEVDKVDKGMLVYEFAELMEGKLDIPDPGFTCTPQVNGVPPKVAEQAFIDKYNYLQRIRNNG